MCRQGPGRIREEGAGIREPRQQPLHHRIRALGCVEQIELHVHRGAPLYRDQHLGELPRVLSAVSTFSESFLHLVEVRVEAHRSGGAYHGFNSPAPNASETFLSPAFGLSLSSEANESRRFSWYFTRRGDPSRPSTADHEASPGSEPRTSFALSLFTITTSVPTSERAAVLTRSHACFLLESPSRLPFGPHQWGKGKTNPLYRYPESYWTCGPHLHSSR